MIVSKVGTAGGRLHGVIEERPGQQLAGLVVDHRLVERPAQALRGAAVELALDDRGVERPSDVLGDDVVEDRDDAGLAIDPDVDEVGRGQRREDRRDGAALCLERLEGRGEAVERGSDLGQRQAALRRPLRPDRSVDELEVADIDLEQQRRVGQDLLAQRVGRPLDGAAGRVRDRRFRHSPGSAARRRCRR